MGQRIGRGRLAPGNYARVRARLGGRRAITRRATRHGTGLVLLIAARRGAVRSGLRDDSTAGVSSERPSTVARMVPVRLFLFACVADAAVRPADAAEIHVRSRQRGCLHYARGSRLSYRPGQYVAERIIVAFISALSLTVIAIADFSNRMVEKKPRGDCRICAAAGIGRHRMAAYMPSDGRQRDPQPALDIRCRRALRGKPRIGAIARKTHLTAALAHRYPAKVPSAPSQMGLSRD